MTRKEMTSERAQSDARINSAERGGIGRSQIESLFKTHYTQMYHLALTLLFDEAESKDVVSDVFASLLSGRVVMRADNAKAFLLASVRHRCLNVLQHKQVHCIYSKSWCSPLFSSKKFGYSKLKQYLCTTRTRQASQRCSNVRVVLFYYGKVFKNTAAMGFPRGWENEPLWQ